jgi:hypothetical protein
MNLRDTRILLRPRSIGEVLDLTFPFCARANRTLLRVAAVTLLPLLAGCALLRFSLGVPWEWVWAIAVLGGGVAQGVFALVAGRLLFEEKPKVAPLLKQFVRRLPAFSASLLVTRLGLLATSWTVVLPLFAWARFLFVPEVLLLEDAGPLRAIGRSSRFVVGRTFEVLGMLCVLLTVQLAFVLVSELLLASLVRFVFQMGEPFGSLFEGGSLYALAGYFASVPFIAVARFLGYIDLRTRKEGWDIALRFRAIAAEDEERSGNRVSREDAA